MPRNPHKRRCTQTGCRAWAQRDGTLCAAHAGRGSGAGGLAETLAAAPIPRPETWDLPTLESEIILLAARRNAVDELLRKRLEQPDWEAAQALRYLAILAQVARSLATMLAQRAATGGAGEIERFFEAVTMRMRELGAGEAPEGDQSDDQPVALR